MRTEPIKTNRSISALRPSGIVPETFMEKCIVPILHRIYLGKPTQPNKLIELHKGVR